MRNQAESVETKTQKSDELDKRYLFWEKQRKESKIMNTITTKKKISKQKIERASGIKKHKTKIELVSKPCWLNGQVNCLSRLEKDIEKGR